jgi:hypothetical protein
MKPTVWGHEKAMSRETARARAEAWIMERPGRPETAGCLWGVLSGIVDRRWGKPIIKA